MNIVFTSGGPAVGPVGMALAAIAYAPGRAAVEQQLADRRLPTQGRWQPQWFAADAANQVFVARDVESGQQAVVIRGSVTDPRTEAFWIDWFKQDLSVFAMADWPHGGAPAGSRLSHGALDGLNSLLSLEDADGQSLVAHLRAHGGVARTPVIGHSLGGALAYVLAPYLAMQLDPQDAREFFWPVTFAAPTVGNAVYAGWLAASFDASSARFWNSEDVVPHAWAALPWVASSFPAGSKLPHWLGDIVKAIGHLLLTVGDRYVQPGDGQMLRGTFIPQHDWFSEAGLQHSGETYESLLGSNG